MKRFLRLTLIPSLTVVVVIVAAIVVPLSGTLVRTHAQAPTSAPGDWPTYLYGYARSGFNSAETIINLTSAPNLKLKQTAKTSGCLGSPSGPPSISTQPVVVQALQRIFWGSWDGCEHATDLSGHEVWATYLGQTSNPQCSFPSTLGVASTATVATETIGGTSMPVLFVGGGDANFYALNPSTGAVIWKRSLGSATGTFIWSSPAVFRRSVYVGVSSQLDCPLVQGKFVQMDVSTGVVQHTFNVVPNGCTGGSVWGSPAIDAAAGTLYFGTGNRGRCSQPTPFAVALVELSASNLAFIGSWQVPASQQVPDSDFGSTPTLFQATIGGVLQQLVGLENKNGIYYTLARGKLSQGPLWQATIAAGSTTAQTEIFSPSAWDGSHLYVAGGHATISGTTCTGNNNEGSLRALNPANGAFLWQDCLAAGNVLGAVTAVPGVAVVGAGPDIVVVATASGKPLFTYRDTSSGTKFDAAASISHGVLYIGSLNGNLYAFAP